MATGLLAEPRGVRCCSSASWRKGASSGPLRRGSRGHRPRDALRLRERAGPQGLASRGARAEGRLHVDTTPGRASGGAWVPGSRTLARVSSRRQGSAPSRLLFPAAFAASLTSLENLLPVRVRCRLAWPVGRKPGPSTFCRAEKHRRACRCCAAGRASFNVHRDEKRGCGSRWTERCGAREQRVGVGLNFAEIFTHTTHTGPPATSPVLLSASITILRLCVATPRRFRPVPFAFAKQHETNDPRSQKKPSKSCAE